MSTPSVEQMREQIAKAYGGDIWQDKVKKMPEQQVIAIYFKMLRDNPNLLKKERSIDNQNKKEEYHQITIFDYVSERSLEK